MDTKWRGVTSTGKGEKKRKEEAAGKKEDRAAGKGKIGIDKDWDRGIWLFPESLYWPKQISC